MDIAQLALQFSIRNADMATCVTGSADPGRVRSRRNGPPSRSTGSCWTRVQILKPIHNWFYIEGRPENNDEPGKKE